MVIYQMMNGKIFKKTLTKMIKAYYMCAQNGVVYKGYTELTGDNLAYVRRYISGKCADRKTDSKNIDEGCGTDELDMVWLNDSLLLIAGKDAVVQGRTLNRAFYRLPVNNEADKKSADVKNTVHNKISNNDLESLKPERIFAGNVVVLKIARTSEGSNEPVDIIDEDIEFIESVLRPIERIYAGVVYLKKEEDLRQSVTAKKVRAIHIYNHIVELFSLCFKKFIEIALKYFGKGDKHINCRVVVAIFHFTENAGCYIDIFKLELGNNFSCF